VSVNETLNFTGTFSSATLARILMPGPGKSKSKSKAGRPRTEVTVPNTPANPLARSIDDAEGWNTVVNILCNVFELPGVLVSESITYLVTISLSFSDLSSRSGLKKVHANFVKIYRRLDNAFEKNMGNDKIMGGIVGIYAKMCADSILRDKLFKAGREDVTFPQFSLKTMFQDFCSN
jgi:hypothetical protein